MMERQPLLVLFGSQTGNAQDVAERIGREAKKRHYAPRVLAMDLYSPPQLPSEAAVVCVAATTGQGDLPDNMKRFWKFLLRRSLPPDSLQATLYTVFGLGDSGYVQYNTVAKKLDRRLAALGAAAVLERGLGDDQHPAGYEAALDPWLARLWPALRHHFPLPPGVLEPPPEDTSTDLSARFRVTFLPADQTAAGLQCASEAAEEATAAAQSFAAMEVAAYRGFESQNEAVNGTEEPLTHRQHKGYGPGRPYLVRMTVNKRITAPSHFQDVRHIEFDLGNSGLTYEPGDLLAILPQQSPAAVAQLLQRLGLDPQSVVRIELADAPTNGTKASSIEVRVGALVAGLIDVSGASPRRYLFELLAHYANAEIEAERLQYFATPEGRDDLHQYNQREGRTLLEVLQDFRSAALPLEWVLQAAPRLRPRLFSIASSPAQHPGRAHIAAAVVQWQTPYKRKRLGLCTTWLAGLDPAAGEVRVPVWTERGTLRLPPDPHTPLLLVGPGTGVAPFRSFLQHRSAAQLAGGPRPAPSHLYFGCRNQAADYYYREEWETYCRDAILGGLVTAFSRDQPQKVYVTHKLREHAKEVWALLQQGAVVYVSGSAEKMPQDVAAALQDVVQEQGCMTREVAQKYMRELELARRYFIESWS